MRIGILSIMLLFLISCASTLNIKMSCRHKALSVAAAAQQYYPVRIAVGEWKGVNHVQTQAYIDNQWAFVKQPQNGNELKITNMQNFKVKGYMTLKEYFNILVENHE